MLTYNVVLLMFATGTLLAATAVSIVLLMFLLIFFLVFLLNLLSQLGYVCSFELQRPSHKIHFYNL